MAKDNLDVELDLEDITDIGIDDSVVEVEIEDSDPSNFVVFKNLEIEEAFKHWIKIEIEAAKSERGELMDKLRNWRKIANNLDVSGREPAWDGASNINVPATVIVLKTATARLRNIFNSRHPFWSIKPLNKAAGNDWIRKAEVLEKYFNIISESRYDLNLYAKNSILLTDLPIAATVWVRIPYSKLVRSITQEGFDTDNISVGNVKQTQVIKSGPELDVIRAEDILYRDNFQDIQMSPWFGSYRHMSWYEVKLAEDNYGWVNVEDMADKGRYTQDETEQLDTQLRNMSSTPSGGESNGIWDIVEFWAYYDVDGDGMMEDIVCYYYPETDTLLSVEPNQLGMRPIRNFPFYLKPYSLEAQGVVELAEDMQAEINAYHNLRTDGIHLTEIPIWAAKLGAGIRPNEKLFPGKLMLLHDPKQDIQMVQNQKQYIETDKMENIDYNYIEKATGISDISGGFSSQMLKSRDTAASQMLRLQAGSEVFMGIVEGLDLAYQEIAEIIYRQLVANRKDVIDKERKARRLSDEEISILEETLNIDVDTIPYALAFKARISDGTETYEGKRQNIMTLVQIYNMYVSQIIPLIQQTYPPGTPIVQTMMMKFVEGATALMEKVFIFFGEEDTQNYMTGSDKLEMLNGILAQMMGGMGGLTSMMGQGQNTNPNAVQNQMPPQGEQGGIQ